MNTNQTPSTDVIEPQAAPTQTPTYDVTETAEEFVITVPIPGADRSGVETVIDGDTLTISAKRNWKQPDGWKLLHEEIPAMDYRLVLSLDHRVNTNALKAHLTNGVLTVMLPKAEAVKPRRIEISS